MKPLTSPTSEQPPKPTWFQQLLTNFSPNEARVSQNNPHLIELYNKSTSLFERLCVSIPDVMLNVIFNDGFNDVLTWRRVSKVFYDLVSIGINSDCSALAANAIVSFEYLINSKATNKKRAFATKNDIVTRINSFSFKFSKLIKNTATLKETIDSAESGLTIILEIKDDNLDTLNHLLLNNELSIEAKDILSRVTKLKIKYCLWWNSDLKSLSLFFKTINEGGTPLDQITTISFQDIWYDFPINQLPSLSQLTTFEIHNINHNINGGALELPFFPQLTTLLIGKFEGAILTLPRLPQLKKLFLDNPYVGLTLPCSDLLDMHRDLPIDQNLLLINTNEIDYIESSDDMIGEPGDYVENNDDYFENTIINNRSCEIIVKNNKQIKINVFISIDDLINQAATFKRKLNFFSKNNLGSTLVITAFDKLTQLNNLLLNPSEDQQLILSKTNAINLSAFNINSESISSFKLFLDAFTRSDTLFSQLTSLKLGDIEVPFTLPNFPNLDVFSFGIVLSQEGLLRLNLPSLPHLSQLICKHNYIVLTLCDYKLDVLNISEDDDYYFNNSSQKNDYDDYCRYYLDEPLLLNIDSLNDLESQRYCEFVICSEYTRRYAFKTVRVLISVNLFLHEIFDFNRNFNFFSRDKVINTLVFSSEMELSKFRNILLNDNLSENQKVILAKTNKINFSILNIDKNTIEDIVWLLSAFAKADTLFPRLRALEFGDVEVSLPFPFLSRLQKLTFKNIYVNFQLPNLPHLRALRFKDIKIDFTIPCCPKLRILKFNNIEGILKLPSLSQLKALSFNDVIIDLKCLSFPKLEMLKFGNIKAKLELESLSTLRELSFKTIYFSLTLPSFQKLKKLSFQHIESSIILADLPKINEFYLGGINNDARLVLPADSRALQYIDMQRFKNNLSKQEKCIIC